MCNNNYNDSLYCYHTFESQQFTTLYHYFSLTNRNRLRLLIKLELQLVLRENDLIELPKEIGELTRLRELHIQGNRLTVLPPEIGTSRFQVSKCHFNRNDNYISCFFFDIDTFVVRQETWTQLATKPFSEWNSILG